MAKKTTVQTEIAGTSAATRKPRELAPEVQEILDRNKNQMKEARSLNKALLAIKAMRSEWALDQLGAVIQRQREAIKTPQGPLIDAEVTAAQ